MSFVASRMARFGLKAGHKQANLYILFLLFVCIEPSEVGCEIDGIMDILVTSEHSFSCATVPHIQKSQAFAAHTH